LKALIMMSWGLNGRPAEIELTLEFRNLCTELLVTMLQEYGSNLPVSFIREYEDYFKVSKKQWEELKSGRSKIGKKLDYEIQELLSSRPLDIIPRETRKFVYSQDPGELLLGGGELQAYQGSIGYMTRKNEESSWMFSLRVAVESGGPCLARVVPDLGFVKTKLGEGFVECRIGEVHWLLWDNSLDGGMVRVQLVGTETMIETLQDSSIVERFSKLGKWVESNKVVRRYDDEDKIIQLPTFQLVVCGQLMTVQEQMPELEVVPQGKNGTRFLLSKKHRRLMKKKPKTMTIEAKWKSTDSWAEAILTLHYGGVIQDVAQIIMKYILQNVLVGRDVAQIVVGGKDMLQKDVGVWQALGEEIRKQRNSLDMWISLKTRLPVLSRMGPAVLKQGALVNRSVLVVFNKSERVRTLEVIPNSVVGMFAKPWRAVDDPTVLFWWRLVVGTEKWKKHKARMGGHTGKVCHFQIKKYRLESEQWWDVYEVGPLIKNDYWIVARTEQGVWAKFMYFGDDVIIQDLRRIPGFMD